MVMMLGISMIWDQKLIYSNLIEQIYYTFYTSCFYKYKVIDKPFFDRIHLSPYL